MTRCSWSPCLLILRLAKPDPLSPRREVWKECMIGSGIEGLRTRSSLFCCLELFSCLFFLFNKPLIPGSAQPSKEPRSTSAWRAPTAPHEMLLALCGFASDSRHLVAKGSPITVDRNSLFEDVAAGLFGNDVCLDWRSNCKIIFGASGNSSTVRPGHSFCLNTCSQ